jgi:hypothetical protein
VLLSTVDHSFTVSHAGRDRDTRVGRVKLTECDLTPVSASERVEAPTSVTSEWTDQSERRARAGRLISYLNLMIIYLYASQRVSVVTMRLRQSLMTYETESLTLSLTRVSAHGQSPDSSLLIPKL